jgi:UDP-galactopyranose mutase
MARPLSADPSAALETPNQTTVLWLYNPHESHLADSVPHDLLIYDIMDEYLGFPWSPVSIESEENDLLKKANWVFAGTQALYDAKQARAGGRIECVLSGVDTAHFARARTPGGWWEAADTHSDIARLSERYDRLIGYAGMIDLRIDQELIALAASRHPEWGFICIGEARTDASLLEETPNIHLLGPLPYSDLPAYYASWDVGLVPFRENRLTLHTNPTKILEYAAAGLPIVAPALPEISRFYGEGAFLYHNDEEFLGHLDTLLTGKGPPTDRDEVRQRTEIASHWSEHRSWDAIAEKMMARIDSLIPPSGEP